MRLGLGDGVSSRAIQGCIGRNVYIFVDEAGTFAKTPERGSFCVVGAVAVPESSMRKMSELLVRFKVNAGFGKDEEVKLKNLSEKSYRSWLKELSKLDLIAIAAATDSSFNSSAPQHKEVQATKIEQAVPTMVHQEGKDMVQGLADRLRTVSDQNYTELLIRVRLVKDVFQLATLYYAQRKPGALASFRWKFDGKEIHENKFEATFRDIAPPLLQSMSLTEGGFQKVKEGNYSHFDRAFAFTGDASWLPLPENPDGEPHGLSHIGKMWNSDLSFVRSHEYPGVQVADLLVSGIRRLLRGEFVDCPGVAEDIGRVMVRREKNSPGLSLFALDSGVINKTIGRAASQAIMSMHQHSKDLFL